MDTEGRMLAQLERAQQGDEDAVREVAFYVFETHKHRIRDLYSIDPAIGPEDLQSTFFEGIVRGITHTTGMVERWRTKGGAFPLSHLGQRGYWNVLSEIRSLQASIAQRDFTPLLNEAGEEHTQVSDRLEGDFREVVVEQIGAQQTVSIIANAQLCGRSRQTVDLILDGTLGDPSEVGFNQRLSEELDVTPQRASQVMAKLRDEVAGLRV